MSFETPKLISDGFPSFLDDSTTQPSPPKNPDSRGLQGDVKSPHPSLLVNIQHNCTFLQDKTPKKRYSPAQVRCYQRIRSGCIAHRGEKLRFLTFTSAPKMKRTIADSHRAIKERIRRSTPLSMFRAVGGGNMHSWMRHYYPNKRPLERLKYEYTKVTTSEGVEGVFHIVFFGDYLPQKWLSDAWESLTGTAYRVHINAVQNSRGSEKRLTNYVVNQYCSGQSEYIRFSDSWGWCFRGFIGKWERFRRTFPDHEERWLLWDNFIKERRRVTTEFRNLWDYGLYSLNARFVSEGAIEHS